MICQECGKYSKKSYGGVCQACYIYFKNGGKVHALPEQGRLEYAENGKVICHICGRAFTRLGSHIRESHAMTIKDYKAKFELCNSTKTTEKGYSQVMRQNAYEHGMPEQLTKFGKSTRIKKGETDKRKNKKVRLQEILNRQSRYSDSKK